jgi:hypothetical protein
VGILAHIVVLAASAASLPILGHRIFSCETPVAGIAELTSAADPRSAWQVQAIENAIL